MRAELSKLAIVSLGEGRLSSTTSIDGTRVTTLVEGAAAGIADQRALGDLLQGLHEIAVAQAVSEVTIDVRELKFLNSSCFKELVSWLSKVQKLPPAERYAVRFLSDPKRHWWHRSSLTALSGFAQGLMTIEEAP